jgi:hypothetical protein
MILLFIRMGSASMFFTTEMTLLPIIISGEALVKANEIHSIIWSFTFSAGMALGGIAVYQFGVYGAILIDSAYHKWFIKAFAICLLILTTLVVGFVSYKTYFAIKNKQICIPEEE